MKTVWLIPLALPLLAAAPPPRPLTLAVPTGNSFALNEAAPAPVARPPAFQPAPQPNRDLAAPAAAPASTEPSLAPTLFTTREQFRGDGFSRGNTAQSEQERKLRPGAGFSLHMPLTPN